MQRPVLLHPAVVLHDDDVELGGALRQQPRHVVPEPMGRALTLVHLSAQRQPLSRLADGDLSRFIDGAFSLKPHLTHPTKRLRGAGKWGTSGREGSLPIRGCHGRGGREN